MLRMAKIESSLRSSQEITEVYRGTFMVHRSEKTERGSHNPV